MQMSTAGPIWQKVDSTEIQEEMTEASSHCFQLLLSQCVCHKRRQQLTTVTVPPGCCSATFYTPENNRHQRGKAGSQLYRRGLYFARLILDLKAVYMEVAHPTQGSEEGREVVQGPLKNTIQKSCITPALLPLIHMLLEHAKQADPDHSTARSSLLPLSPQQNQMFMMGH